jgi:tetratricopeptide (TPR) repeat protein
VHAMAVMDRELAAHGDAPAACGHGNIWLVYSRLQEGKQVGPAVDACLAQAQSMSKQLKELPVVGSPEGAFGSWADMAVRTGIETGKWATWPELPSGKFNFARFVEDYGRVLSSRHDSAAAQSALAAMKADGEIVASNWKKEFPDDDTYLPWVDRTLAQGEAVAVLAEGRTDEGIQLLRRAAEAEAALPPPFGPPALQKPSYEMLGDELLALGRKKDAAAAYQAALEAAPNRRLSVLGLKAATAR